DFTAVLPPALSPVVAVVPSAQWGKPFAPDPLRSFSATTACSAPVPRIGTLALMGPPLAFLPSPRGDRFPRSPQEPESTSRRLYAGCRAGSKQAAPCAYPTGTTPPWF
ncbi:hypothetical protein, partial [Xenorhabdus nematophila]|uniref:hypothetical protein n=1 Tax=Xenorhabdus nematophila TaxID=628 RepID=UPI00190F0CAA